MNATIAPEPTGKKLKTAKELVSPPAPTPPPPTPTPEQPRESLFQVFFRKHGTPDMLPTGDALAELKSTQAECDRLEEIMETHAPVNVRARFDKLRAEVVLKPTPENIAKLRQIGDVESFVRSMCEVRDRVGDARAAALNDVTRDTVLAFWQKCEDLARKLHAQEKAKQDTARADWHVDDFLPADPRIVRGVTVTAHFDDPHVRLLGRLVEILASWRAHAAVSLQETPRRVFKGIIAI